MSTIILIAVLITAAGAYTLALVKFKKTEVWNWLHTFIATILSISTALLVGIILYNYEDRISQDLSKQRIRSLLAVELSNNLDALEQEPSLTITLATSKKRRKVLVTNISNLMLNEAIKSGFFDIEKTKRMALCANNINQYNIETSWLLSILNASNPEIENNAELAAVNVEKAGAILINDIKDLLAVMELERLPRTSALPESHHEELAIPKP
jgi:hypothetical protein